MSVLTVTKDNFENDVIKSEKKVLLDFWASWCGPCRTVAPTVDAISQEHPEYLVGKINVDDEPELAEAFGIESIPTLVVMKNGKAITGAVGVHSKEQILELLETEK